MKLVKATITIHTWLDDSPDYRQALVAAIGLPQSARTLTYFATGTEYVIDDVEVISVEAAGD